MATRFFSLHHGLGGNPGPGDSSVSVSGGRGLDESASLFSLQVLRLRRRDCLEEREQGSKFEVSREHR